MRADLVALMDAVTDAGRAAPLQIEKTEYLQPYAVRFRYDNPTPASAPPLDRTATQLDGAVVSIRSLRMR